MFLYWLWLCSRVLLPFSWSIGYLKKRKEKEKQILEGLEYLGVDWSEFIPLVWFGLGSSMGYKMVYLQLFSCGVQSNIKCYMP